jgi:hypothetical protein
MDERLLGFWISEAESPLPLGVLVQSMCQEDDEAVDGDDGSNPVQCLYRCGVAVEQLAGMVAMELVKFSV